MGFVELFEDSKGFAELFKDSKGFVELFEDSKGFVELFEDSKGLGFRVAVQGLGPVVFLGVFTPETRV